MAELVPSNWREAFADLRDRVTRTLRSWFSNEGRNGISVTRRDSGLPQAFFSGAPLVDLEETDDNLIVSAELPGFAKEDFSVELSGERLIIRGEKKRSSEKKGAGYYYAERSFGSFARVIPLPCETEHEGAKANFENGLLTVTLPKTERAKASRLTKG